MSIAREFFTYRWGHLKANSGMIPEMSLEEYSDVSALTQEEFLTTGGFRWFLLPSSTETASRTLLQSACIFHPAVCYTLWVTNKVKPNNIYKNKSMLVKSMRSYQLHTRKYSFSFTWQLSLNLTLRWFYNSINFMKQKRFQPILRQNLFLIGRRKFAFCELPSKHW